MNAASALHRLSDVAYVVRVISKALASATSRQRGFLAVATLALGAALALGACSTGGGGSAGNATSTPPTTAGSSGSATPEDTTSSSAAPRTSSKPPPPAKPVHVSLFQGDGQVYGVGMPIIAQFSRKVTSARAFDKAVTVKVNGQPAHGAWFWINSIDGYAMEAHYRMEHYWPAHSTLQMNMPLKGLSAGPGLAFDDSLTLLMKIGAAHISQVNGGSERMTVSSDGKVVKTFPVSLGKAATPTYLGTKLVMERKNPQLMIGGRDDPYRIKVPWSVRVTNSGEFVHAASWNTGNIGSRSTSHGCTNLNVSDAQWFYNFAVKGDVVTYTNTGTSNVMPSWDGWGDWNVSWSDWEQGNLLKNY
jgi:lipoprotein-anchoring transpeptidase ErfK/SrfK